MELNDAVVDAYRLSKFMIFINEYPLDRVAFEGAIHADNAQRVEDQKEVYGR
ncbi:hypothetical protein [Fodinicola acaciae]|uniref:hypothetical protein n=1 Tax=Fodinicola acaciae TaxID=2681555 RepID=UPI0013D25B99|nr:hypothetical protein [Fodinicola acaciae]